MIEFNRYFDFIKYFGHIKKKYIGRGKEGICYLGKDGLVHKKFYKPQDIPVNNIILEGDYNLNSFVFPKDLYYVQDKVVGSTSKYIPNNLFNKNKINKNIKDIDIDSLIEAYYILLDDTKEISKDNIMLIDIPCNMIFTGYRLYAIDTLCYEKNNVDKYDDNKRNIEVGIKDIFDEWYKERNRKNIFDDDIVTYLKEIEKEQQKVKIIKK